VRAVFIQSLSRARSFTHTRTRDAHDGMLLSLFFKKGRGNKKFAHSSIYHAYPMRNAINVLKAIERTRARAFFVKLEII
jgi:hypothetical protein